MRIARCIVPVVLCVVAVIVAGCAPDHSAIVFRQHELERRRDASPEGVLDAAFNDPQAVLGAVFARLPRHCRVEPTEGYYYFRAALMDRQVSGNLRLVSDAQGDDRLLFAYFDVLNPRAYHALTLGDGDDAVRLTRTGEHEVRVQLGDQRRWFIDASRIHRAPSPGLRLRENESFVSGVFDESGVRFDLVFNHDTGYFCFYQIPGDEPDEDWHPVAQVGDWIVLRGRSSGFVLIARRDEHRRLLVGVAAEHVRLNTYFDGPFDQVPPDLDIRPLLERAYPYVTHGSGIDPHGNFIDEPGSRVAISPYQTYADLDRFIERVRTVLHDAPGFEQAHPQLCYESKRDFRPDDSEPVGTRAWPANHFRTVSYSWDE